MSDPTWPIERKLSLDHPAPQHVVDHMIGFNQARRECIAAFEAWRTAEAAAQAEQWQSGPRDTEPPNSLRRIFERHKADIRSLVERVQDLESRTQPLTARRLNRIEEEVAAAQAKGRIVMDDEHPDFDDLPRARQLSAATVEQIRRDLGL